MNVDDDYPLLQDFPGSLWVRGILMRYQMAAVEGNFSDYPQEFLQAVERYTDAKFVFRSEIWRELRRWRQYAKRNPESAPWFLSPPSPLCDDSVFVVHFKELIIAAVFYGQEDILRALFETARLAQAPDPDIEPVRAVITAFRQLFKGGGKDDWPRKKEVKQTAIDILRNAGLPIPSSRRQWTRIFENAGLSKLRSGKRQPKRLAVI